MVGRNWEQLRPRWPALARCVMASQLTLLQYKVVVIDVVCGQRLAGNHLAIPEKDQYSITRQHFISQFLYYYNMNLWYCSTHTYTHTAPTSPQFLSQPSNTTAALSSTVTLSCSTTGNPLPSIAWYKDGLPLTTDSRRQQDAGTGSLRITNLQNSDSGRYQCVASNTAGRVASLTAILQIACKYASVLMDVWWASLVSRPIPRFSLLPCKLGSTEKKKIGEPGDKSDYTSTERVSEKQVHRNGYSFRGL